MTTTLLHGDCREVLRTLADCSVDSVVTDPPYELGFMGKQWDASGVAYDVDLWREVLRVLKPGGHLCAFGGTRTYHRMAVAIEDAGFEIRDSLHWVYGSGFPKSLDVSKAIDKAGGDSGQRLFRHELASAIKASGLTFADIDRRLGVKSTSCYWVRQDHRACLPAPHHWQALAAFLPLSEDLSNLYVQCEREVVGNKRVTGEKGVAGGFANGIASLTDKDSVIQREVPITAPATDAAKQWDGWGTALKPAHEPIVLARRPLVGTVAANVLEHGTGALNIDGTRVAADDKAKFPTGVISQTETIYGDGAGRYANRPRSDDSNPSGRWPANVILDVEAGALLDKQSGVTKDGVAVRRNLPPEGKPQDAPTSWSKPAKRDNDMTYGGQGGASRFFTSIEWEPEVDVPFRYIAKPSKRERNAGLELCRCGKLSPTDQTEGQTWDDEDRAAAPPAATDRSRPRDTDGSTTATSNDSAWSMSSSGSNTTDQSPRGIKSTTSTTTNSITASRTSNLSTPSSTSESTRDVSSATANGASRANFAANSNPSPTSIGTSAEKDGLCTDDADPATFGESLRTSVAGRCDRCSKINTAHPTQKPLALMRWLVRLVTPPGGTVLEPFAGSGTTLMACVLEGLDSIGIEMTDEYLPIIEGRVAWAEQQAAQQPTDATAPYAQETLPL